MGTYQTGTKSSCDCIAVPSGLADQPIEMPMMTQKITIRPTARLPG
jgi:hypothetical protein